MPQTSDFVKKLYKMLESPEYQSIVSWGPKGDCFIVKDMTEFTKKILPKLFKHSNFASFVRQLNKYDFHKIKHSDDDESDDDESWWTFRHPDFTCNNRGALENIKRKSQKLSSQPSGSGSGLWYPSSQPVLPKELQHEHEELKAEVDELRRTVDDMRSRISDMETRWGGQGTPTISASSSSPMMVSGVEDNVPSSKLQGFDQGSPEQLSESRMPSTSNIPDFLSSSLQGLSNPPKILLVDDDPVARKLSTKFLEKFGCSIDTAVDGVDAISKMNLTKYDLVLMDIVMPNLDGLSATNIIRRFDQQTPIISMTGNSRPDDVVAYCSSGMNDVLSKPFTRKGLYYMLEKHLTPNQVPPEFWQQPPQTPVLNTPLAGTAFDQSSSASNPYFPETLPSSSSSTFPSNLSYQQPSSASGSTSQSFNASSLERPETSLDTSLDTMAGELASVGFGFSDLQNDFMTAPLSLGGLGSLESEEQYSFNAMMNAIAQDTFDTDEALNGASSLVKQEQQSSPLTGNAVPASTKRCLEESDGNGRAEKKRRMDFPNFNAF